MFLSIKPKIGSVVQVFTIGAMIQMFQLAERVPTDTWSGNTFGDQL
jgi:hypothetical protein